MAVGHPGPRKGADDGVKDTIVSSDLPILDSHLAPTHGGLDQLLIILRAKDPSGCKCRSTKRELVSHLGGGGEGSLGDHSRLARGLGANSLGADGVLESEGHF